MILMMIMMVMMMMMVTMMIMMSSFLTLVLAIGNIVVWGSHGHRLPFWICPDYCNKEMAKIVNCKEAEQNEAMII